MSRGSKIPQKRRDKSPRAVLFSDLNDDEAWLSSLFFDTEDTDHLLDEDLKLYRDIKMEVKKKRRTQSSHPLCSLHSLSAPNPKNPGSPNTLVIPPPSILVVECHGNMYPPFPVTLYSSQEDLISNLHSMSSSSGYSLDLRTSVPLPMRLRQHKISRDNSVIFSLSGESIRGPLVLLGKGAFGYALKCVRAGDSHEFVLKIDTRYNYALWDALVQAKVLRMRASPPLSSLSRDDHPNLSCPGERTSAKKQ